MGRVVYLKKPADYIACDNMEFAWARADVELVKRLWENGASGAGISKALDRDPDEVALLLIGLANEDDQTLAIGPRRGGWRGNEWRPFPRRIEGGLRKAIEAARGFGDGIIDQCCKRCPNLDGCKTSGSGCGIARALDAAAQLEAALADALEKGEEVHSWM